MPEGQIIVTGGSRGIGRAIVDRFVRDGHRVAVLSRTGECRAGYGIACDVADEESVVRAIAQVAARGPIAGLVNNAGFQRSAPSDRITASDFEEVLRTNATSVVVVSREVHPHLKAAGGGMIVNIGSFFDKLGVPENVAYCASKAAVAAITRCHAVEWAGDGITVLDVAPGYIETDLNRNFLANDKVKAWLNKRVPVARPGRPEEVADLVALLFAARNGFLTGETIYLDGGQGMNH